MRSLSERNGHGQAGGESAVRSEFAWHGRRADRRICSLAAMASMIAATYCNKQTARIECTELDAPGVVRQCRTPLSITRVT